MTKSVLPSVRHTKDISHFKPVIESLPVGMTSAERYEAVKLVEAYQDVFPRDEYDLGRTRLIEHRIETGEARPIRQGLRRHRQVHLEVIDKEVKKMEGRGVIEPSCSPWTSNVVVVTKHDNTPTITLDYRALNSITYKDS